MGRSARKTLLVCVLLVGALTLAACGAGEAELEAPEGEPVELGPLHYNVQITRFLNPRDAGDDAYLVGQPEAGEGKTYLGVFLTIDNESEATQSVPEDFELVDTRENSFPATPSESSFALQFGASIPPNGEVPEPGTAAASGPIGGSMILFLVEETTAENRPLKLEIPPAGGPGGAIELDI